MYYHFALGFASLFGISYTFVDLAFNVFNLFL